MKTNHVLIVEDEVLIAMAMKAELQRSGIERCEFVSSGEQALEYCGTHDPDLILMDIHLAGELDGIETAELITKMKESRFIFMSGYEDKNILKRIKPLNPISFLEKPVYTDDLLKLLG